MKKKILALILVVMMLLPCFHITVSAAANPYTEVAATTYDRNLSSATGGSNSTNAFQDMENRVGSIWHYSYLAYPLDFGDTPPSHMEITASAHANYADTVVVRLDSASGEIIAEIMFEKLGFGTPSTSKIALEKRLTGEHTIYITTKKSTMNFHSFRFIAPKEKTFTYDPYTPGGVYTDLEAGSVASAADLLWQLGMVQNKAGEEFSPDTIASRGWFANAVYGIYKERESGAYIEQEGVTYETGFKDVNNTSPYAEAIKFLSEQGIVNGTEDGAFAPHQYIQAIDAVVILLRVLGYEETAKLEGGYPNGYLKAARKAGLFSSGDGTAVLSRGDAAVLLAKALEADYLSFGSLLAPDIVRYEKLQGILGVYRGLKRGEGKVTATPASGLSIPKTGLKNTQVEIGGVLYDIGKTSAIALLGYDCEFYYKEENGTRVLYAIAPSSDVEIELISSKTHDILEISDNKIVYTSDDNEENEVVEIEKGTNVFYNCVAIEGSLTEVVQNEETFTGTMTFIENEDGSRAIFVEEYEDYIIESVDLEGLSFTSDNGTRKVWWNIGDTVVIIDEQGDDLLIEDLATDSVATVYQSRNTTGIKVIRMYLEKAEMEGTVTAIKDGKTYINGTERVISNSLKADMGVGREGIFRLNIYGDVVSARAKDPNPWQVGLLMSYAKEDTGFETISKVKIMSTEPKEYVYNIASTFTADGIRLKDGADIINGVVTSDGTWIGLKNIEAETAIRYRLNSDGKVYQMDTPSVGANTAEDTMKCILTTDSTNILTYYRTPELVVAQKDNHRGMLYMSNSATVMGFYGTEAHNEQNCVAGPATTIISRTEFDPYGKFYSTSGDDYVADLFVWPDCTSSLEYSGARLIYTHTSEGVDAEGDVVTLINGYAGGRLASYIYNKNGDVEISESSINVLDNAKCGDVIDLRIVPNSTIIQGATISCLADGADSRTVGDITITPTVCKTTTSSGSTSRSVFGKVVEKGEKYIVVQIGKDADGKPITEMLSVKTAGIYSVATTAVRTEAAVNVAKFSNIAVGDVVFAAISSGACGTIVIFEDATM